MHTPRSPNYGHRKNSRVMQSLGSHDSVLMQAPGSRLALWKFGKIRNRPSVLLIWLEEGFWWKISRYRIPTVPWTGTVPIQNSWPLWMKMVVVGQEDQVEEAGGAGGEEGGRPPPPAHPRHLPPAHPHPRHLPQFGRQPDLRLTHERLGRGRKNWPSSPCFMESGQRRRHLRDDSSLYT